MKTAEGQNLSKPNKHRLRQAFEKGSLPYTSHKVFVFVFARLGALETKKTAPVRVGARSRRSY